MGVCFALATSGVLTFQNKSPTDCVICVVKFDLIRQIVELQLADIF